MQEGVRKRKKKIHRQNQFCVDLYLQHTKLGTKIKFSFHHQCFIHFTLVWIWMNWIQIKKRLNPMEFPLFSHSIFLSVLLCFVCIHFLCVWLKTNTQNFDSILMHLFRWTMKDVDFAKTKKKRRHNRSRMKWEKKKKWLLLKNQFNTFTASFALLVFVCVFFCCIFDDFSILNLFLCVYVWY